MQGIQVLNPWEIPFLNTMILFSSGEEAMHRIPASADWLDSPVSRSCTSGCLGFANPEASQQLHNERQHSCVSSKLFL